MDKKMFYAAIIVLLLAASFYAGYAYNDRRATGKSSSSSLERLLIKGFKRDNTPRVGILVAMPIEAKYVFERMRINRSFSALGYNFTTGVMAGKPVVVVISGIGEEAASSAVTATYMLFNVKWFVDIGTAGSHSLNHDTGDVIVASRIIPYGNRKYTSYEGWSYMRLGVTLPNGTWVRFLYLNCSEELVKLAEKASSKVSLPETPAELIGSGKPYKPRIVLNGTIASADVWTANKTFINRIHGELDTDAEEMEAYGFGLACYKLGVPFIKIAVISDNELTGSPWKPESIKVSMRNGVALLEKMLELS